MAFVMGLADAVTVLDFGRRIAGGAPADVQQRPRGAARLPGRRAEPEGNRHEQLRGAPAQRAVPGLHLTPSSPLGFVVVFRATEVVNFAHGSLLLLGAYVVATLHDTPRLLARRCWPASRARPSWGRGRVPGARRHRGTTRHPRHRHPRRGHPADHRTDPADRHRRAGDRRPVGANVVDRRAGVPCAHPDRRGRRGGPALRRVPARVRASPPGAWPCGPQRRAAGDRRPDGRAARPGVAAALGAGRRRSPPWPACS